MQIGGFRETRKPPDVALGGIGAKAHNCRNRTCDAQCGNVVVHVRVKEAIDHSHLQRPTVQAVIEDIFNQTGVLRESIDHHQPGVEEIG